MRERQEQRRHGAGEAIPVLDHALDLGFRQATGSGNAAFATGDHGRARSHYREALAEAERVFETALDGDGPAILLAPMVLTIACQNLAAAHARAGAGEDARRLARFAPERLLAVAGSPANPLALRINCLRHLRHALPGVAASDLEPAAVEALRMRTSEVAQAVLRTALLMRGVDSAPADLTARTLC